MPLKNPRTIKNYNKTNIRPDRLLFHNIIHHLKHYHFSNAKLTFMTHLEKLACAKSVIRLSSQLYRFAQYGYW